MWTLRNVLIVSLLSNVYAWKIFFRGRETGGNIGKPLSETNSVTDIPEEWFTQALDHFNPVEDRTWQQVSHLLLVFIFCITRLFQ